MIDTIIVPTHTFNLGHGRVLATHVPGGGRISLTVLNVATGDGGTVYVGFGRVEGDDAASFAIAAGRDQADVVRVTRAWRESATATVSSDRISYVQVT